MTQCGLLTYSHQSKDRYPPVALLSHNNHDSISLLDPMITLQRDSHSMRRVGELGIRDFNFLREVGGDPVDGEGVGEVDSMNVKHIPRPVEVRRAGDPVPIDFAQFVVMRSLGHRSRAGALALTRA